MAAISGGWSGGSLHVTAVNAKAGVMDGHSDRYATTAHEPFHQLQYEMSHGRDTDKTALFWLEEGSADYVGAMMAETRNEAEKTIPDQRLTSAAETPSSIVRYIGRNGMSMV